MQGLSSSYSSSALTTLVRGGGEGARRRPTTVRGKWPGKAVGEPGSKLRALSVSQAMHLYLRRPAIVLDDLWMTTSGEVARRMTLRRVLHFAGCERRGV
jgi:hypothetical protein